MHERQEVVMKNVTFLAAVVVALGVTAAHANSVNTVTARFDSIINREAVHVKNGSEDLYVWSGLSKFEKLSIDPDETTNPAYYLDTVFSGYCIDLKEEISWDFEGTWQLAPLEEAPIGAGQPAMGTGRADLLRNLWGSYFNDPHNAEFQVAVWELLAETSGDYDVTNENGAFYVKTADDDEVDVSMINTWLDVVTDENYSGQVASVVWAMVSDGTQDFAVLIETGGAPPVIPEPVTMLGLLAGIGGLIHYARKRGGRAPVR